MTAPMPSPVVRQFEGEARIIMPTHDNKGRPLGFFANRLRARLVDAFGGYTETGGTGGYAGAMGATTDERAPVIVFDIACDRDARPVLVAIAQWLARVADQECIYLRLPTGEVLLVEGVVP